MIKRITAVSVTLILLLTLGGKHEQIYLGGQYQGIKGSERESSKVTGQLEQSEKSDRHGTIRDIRPDGDHGLVSRDVGKRHERIEPVEVSYDGGAINSAQNNESDNRPQEATDQNAGVTGQDAGTFRGTGAIDIGLEAGPEADEGGGIDVSEIGEQVWEGENTYSPAADETSPEYLGDWTISFYCNCPECCGSWSGGPTASGAMPTPWYTVATGGLDFGTILYIDGLGYFEVQDRGTDYGWADVFVSDHGEALANGLQTRAVYIVR